MKKLLKLAVVTAIPFTFLAQGTCDRRTFIASASQYEAGFTVLTYGNDQLDSLRWNYGDGTIETQNENVGTGSAGHTYAGPGTYTVTLEQWGVQGAPENPEPFYCVYSKAIEIYDYFTDSMCGAEFQMIINGSMVTFSNTSVIHAPGFNSHPEHPLWEFGNGANAGFINRLYDVHYDDGTYTACLYYSGYSFNNGGYLYNCQTCQTFTIDAGTASIGEESTSRLEMFPNPASGSLTLRSSDEIEQVTISDIAGKMQRFETSGSGTELMLDIAHLSPGTYFVKLSSGNGNKVTRQFVKY